MATLFDTLFTRGAIPVLERTLVDMMLASRAYEANLTAMQVSKVLADSVSRIIA